MKKIQISILILLMMACGSNLFKSLDDAKQNDSMHIDNAIEYLSKKNYTKAQKELDAIKGLNVEKTISQVAIFLGKSGLSLWDIINNLLKSTSKTQNSSGSNQLFDSLTENVFGTNEIRTSRISALNQSITLLKNDFPSNKRTHELACLLAGFLAVSRIADSTKELEKVTTIFENFNKNIIGAGSTADQCPGIDTLNQQLTEIRKIQADLQLVLDETAGCDLFNALTNGSAINAVEAALKKFTQNADKGCDTTADCSGLFCQVLQTGCIRTILGSSSVRANDGKVEICEIMENCQKTGTCF